MNRTNHRPAPSINTLDKLHEATANEPNVALLGSKKKDKDGNVRTKLKVDSNRTSLRGVLDRITTTRAKRKERAQSEITQILHDSHLQMTKEAPEFRNEIMAHWDKILTSINERGHKHAYRSGVVHEYTSETLEIRKTYVNNVKGFGQGAGLMIAGEPGAVEAQINEDEWNSETSGSIDLDDQARRLQEGPLKRPVDQNIRPDNANADLDEHLANMARQQNEPGHADRSYLTDIAEIDEIVNALSEVEDLSRETQLRRTGPPTSADTQAKRSPADDDETVEEILNTKANFFGEAWDKLQAARPKTARQPNDLVDDTSSEHDIERSVDHAGPFPDRLLIEEDSTSGSEEEYLGEWEKAPEPQQGKSLESAHEGEPTVIAELDDILSALETDETKPTGSVSERAQGHVEKVFSKLGQALVAKAMAEEKAGEIAVAVLTKAGPLLKSGGLAHPDTFKGEISEYMKSGMTKFDSVNFQNTYLDKPQGHVFLDSAFAAFKTARSRNASDVRPPIERPLAAPGEGMDLSRVRAPSQKGTGDPNADKLMEDLRQIGQSYASGDLDEDAVAKNITTAFLELTYADPVAGDLLARADGDLFKTQAVRLMKQGAAAEGHEDIVDTFLKNSDVVDQAFEQFQTRRSEPWKVVARLDSKGPSASVPGGSRQLPRVAAQRLAARDLQAQEERANRRKAETRGDRVASDFEKAATRIGVQLARLDLKQSKKSGELVSYADMLAAAYRSEVAADPKKSVAFVFRDPDKFKAQATEALIQGLKPEQEEAVREILKISSFLDDAFKLASNKLLGKSLLDSEELKSTTTFTYPYKNATEKTLRDFRIGKTVYKAVRQLGEGSFGEVFEFKAQDGSDKRLAVKYVIEKKAGNDAESLATWAQTQTTVAAEVVVQAFAAGGKHPNVLGLETIIRSAEDGICIAMPIAPHGTAWDAAALIKEAESDGRITPNQADVMRLTFLKDMSEGLKELHRNGIRHDDLKTPNAFVGAKGYAKIADYGTARMTPVSKFGQIDKIDNSRWQAPERLDAGKTVAELKVKLHKSVTAKRDEVRKRLKKDLKISGKKIAEADLNKLVADCMRPVIEGNEATIREKESQFEIGLSSDAWALGICAIDLFGTLDPPDNSRPDNSPLVGGPLDVGGTLAQEKAILAFAEDPERIALAPSGVKAVDGKLPGGALAESTGNAKLDAAVNGALRVRPQDRLTAKEFAQSSVFADRKIGSQAARDLFIALKSGAPNAIADAKIALAQVN